MLQRIKSTLSVVLADLADTYKRLKIVIIAIGAAIIYFEWQRIKEALLVYQGKKEMQANNKEDADLKAKESTDSQQADTLAKKAPSNLVAGPSRGNATAIKQTPVMTGGTTPKSSKYSRESRLAALSKSRE